MDFKQQTHLSLDGLSVGDSFGQRFFFPWIVEQTVNRTLPEGPWHYTDDTEMAIAVLQVLESEGHIDQDLLAEKFARRYAADPRRGYGAGAQELLRRICDGHDWRTASRELFNGSGSFGNGGAMRVPPLGVWFANDIDKLKEQARLSAEVTHSHAEGQEGAVAVALAAAWAVNNDPKNAADMLPWIIEHLDNSTAVCTGIKTAMEFELDAWAFDVANKVGCGDQVTAQDTVPFCLWMSAATLNDFEDAMWTTARIGGDIDTNCAIVGGIVAAARTEPIPEAWLSKREPLDYRLA
ncbi:MAG: ADP-ribosylglycohydrolase family protein [Planctomycetaceae bacterium]